VDNINENVYEAIDIDDIPETIVLPNHKKKFVSVVCEDSEVNESFVPLVSQRNLEVKKESESLDMDNQTLENVTVEDISENISDLISKAFPYIEI